MDTRHCFFRVALLTTVVGWGCGKDSGSGIVVIGPPRESQPLLLSEVHAADRPADLLDREFALHNRSPAPQTVRLVGTSCSCYGVMLDGQSWEKGESVTFPSGVERLLAFDVQPPGTPSEKSWSVRFASGADGTGGQREHVLTLSTRVVRDLALDPEVTFVSLRKQAKETQVGSGDSEQSRALRHRLVITHRWRSSDDPEKPPEISGLPEGVVSTLPKKVGEQANMASGLREQQWATELVIDAAQASSGDEASGKPHEFRVSVGDLSTNAPHAVGRIVFNVISGIRAPSVVHWGRLPQHTSHNRRIVIAATDKRPFRIEEARLQISDRKFTLENRDAGTAPNSPSQSDAATLGLSSPQLELNVVLDAGSSATRHFASLELTPCQVGAVNATLILETDHPLMPTVEVQLRAISIESTARAEAAGG